MPEILERSAKFIGAIVLIYFGVNVLIGIM